MELQKKNSVRFLILLAIKTVLGLVVHAEKERNPHKVLYYSGKFKFSGSARFWAKSTSNLLAVLTSLD